MDSRDFMRAMVALAERSCIEDVRLYELGVGISEARGGAGAARA